MTKGEARAGDAEVVESRRNRRRAHLKVKVDCQEFERELRDNYLCDVCSLLMLAPDT
jgi:hypothetical protein